VFLFPAPGEVAETDPALDWVEAQKRAKATGERIPGMGLGLDLPPHMTHPDKLKAAKMGQRQRSGRELAAVR
jgi:hypothetical protein